MTAPPMAVTVAMPPVRPLPTAALDYPLDERVVATRPAHPRDAARMMVVHLESGRVEHRRVWDLPAYLSSDDVVVLNRTRVAPARLRFRRLSDGRESEGLCLQPTGPRTWEAMIKRARNFASGDRLALISEDLASSDCVTLGDRTREGFQVDFGDAEPAMVLERSGWPPLPPYIVAARDRASWEPESGEDRAWYQTVFAALASRPSVAAPTAGLHFTPSLLEAVRGHVGAVVEVELQVGTGTFRPVTCPNLSDHPMHEEWCGVPPDAVRALGSWGAGGTGSPGPRAGRLIAVGTTSVRVLESLPRPLPEAWTRGGAAAGLCFDTRLLLAPGAEFRWVDALLTNFHLPGSTLLALVGAFAGLDRVKEWYALAQREGYRFYSYGDAMLLLRQSE